MRKISKKELALVDMIKTVIIDDSESTLYVLKQVIDRHGDFKVVKVFSNPQKAFKTFVETPEKIDLLIVDYQMPSMNGVELISELNKLKKRKYFTCIVILSAVKTPELHTKAKDIAFASEYFTKPILFEDLEEIKNEYFKKQL